MTSGDWASVEERIAQIQLNAFENMGLSPPDILHEFARRRQEIVRFSAARPGYLGSRIPQTPDWDHYIERNLRKRYNVPTPTPFQDPYLYSYLSDVWGYYRARIYAEDAFASDLVLATAPTGRFNALAIPGTDKNGILIEDGLLHFAREFVKLTSEILYVRAGKNFEVVDPGPALQRRIGAHVLQIDSLIDLTLGYLVDGYITPPKPSDFDLDDQPGGDIHNVIFHGFVVFVLEHELHHLIAEPQGLHVLPSLETSFDAMWQTFEQDVIPHLSTKVDKEVIRSLHAQHQEEILADYRAMNRLLALGRIDHLVWPLLDGGMLFFHMAELIRWVTLKIEDPERLILEQKIDGRWLTISAILHQESHPYPLLRRSGVIARTKAHNVPYAELLIEREKRLIQLFNAIRLRFNQRHQDLPLPQHINRKWRIAEKALFGST
ncbi:hypothetical protein [Tropicibacter naphthalenivorans]|uniref:Uncharacterized protein n=1 Tax=Tropicibacter naphthalenivorans TaxID=441103 RepID=A0A0P1GHY1_9RHOB|nr:hypothetical protein [Tropicibacter naphthalenivorans]CUH81396.1 hypothetical protein TRN7648_03447 [Tropicibacter naphthalenivorans]SMD00590.1 hypothetical protein SAMN04488093_109143 [Tropicibacter naphthalenivorans]